jgi:flavin-dependent dehydrogenase
MLKDFDVVIVGARCAGAATALLLAQSGVRVLVVDKSFYGSDTLSTHALMRGAVMQLHRWGVLPRIQAAGTPAVRRTVFGYPSREIEIAIEPKHGVHALYAPRRTVLDRALVDAASQAGAEFAFRRQLTRLEFGDAGRVVGVHLDSTQGTRLVRANLVIGADGVHSLVARQVGAEVVARGTHTAANLYSYWHSVTSAGYEWHYNSAASIGAITTNGATCVFVSVPSRAFAAELRGNATLAYERLLRTQFPAFAVRLDGARRVEPVRGFGGVPGFLRRAAGPGWALVGDAGYFKDPLTAHGITDALRDAELLARAILTGTDEGLAHYQETRDDLSIELLRSPIASPRSPGRRTSCRRCIDRSAARCRANSARSRNGSRCHACHRRPTRHSSADAHASARARVRRDLWSLQPAALR